MSVLYDNPQSDVGFRVGNDKCQCGMIRAINAYSVSLAMDLRGRVQFSN